MSEGKGSGAWTWTWKTSSSGSGGGGGAAAAASAPACKDAGQQLVLCMERAPCVTQGRHASISECLKAGDTEGCEALRRGYFECRRGQLDMRSRIRGRKHLDTGEQPPS